MQIGAIGGYSYQPYIYNSNTLSVDSMDKISAIGDDMSASDIDFSSLVDDVQNINPLQKGETANFADILEQQMQTSRVNAAYLLS